MKNISCLNFVRLVLVMAIVIIPMLSQAQYDDVYYTPSKDRPTETAPAQQADEQPSAVDQSQQSYDSEQLNGTNDNARGSQSSDSYSATDDYGNTYITNNYYDDDNDYYYASRLRRFHRPFFGYGYYDDIYVNRYWYDYQPASWGLSIYMGSCFPAYGFYTRPAIVYNPYCYYNYSYYNPYWYDPFFCASPYYANFNNPWYNSWYGNNYWGMNNGYNNGYWNGYYDGVYGNNNFYNNNGGANNYYGHRGGIASNSNRHRDRSYQTVSSSTTNNISHYDGRIKNPANEGNPIGGSIKNDNASVKNPVKTAPTDSRVSNDRDDIGTVRSNPNTTAPIGNGSVKNNGNPVRNNGDGRVNDGRGFPTKEQMNTVPITPRETAPPVYNQQPTRGNGQNAPSRNNQNDNSPTPGYNQQPTRGNGQMAPSRNNQNDKSTAPGYNQQPSRYNNEYNAPQYPNRNNGGGRSYNPYDNGGRKHRNDRQAEQPTPKNMNAPQRDEPVKKAIKEQASAPSYSAPTESRSERSYSAPQRSESSGFGGRSSSSGNPGSGSGGGGRHR